MANADFQDNAEKGSLRKVWNDFRTQPLAAVREWQNHRLTWGIMLGTAVFLEICAFYFQYGMDLYPCEMCVYQRFAVLVLGLAAGIMLVAPRNKGVRGAGYLLWISGAVYGLQYALQQIKNYADFNPFFSACNAFPVFPFGLPLHEWWPAMFFPTGMCGEDSWTFLSLNMANWMTIIFGIYILAFAVCVLSVVVGKLADR
ncbi:disulfide bond formation protein DsbB [Endozoicomonas montiporae]|uniref:Disulfide bond formation protein B n=1 Tax=Endozoicomonas montiporae CL-33 TaxID=570277 RepID=A0A142B791_9GAMM|nr:disulfide bond formation protein DsbB [Endozoicomonas montiporae]AMO54617.1 disulfide bond formation protein B [Endozoicomonas montiporae CL-33]